MRLAEEKTIHATSALSDRFRGYCLEMICADFLAGAHADGGTPEVLLRSLLRLFQLAPAEQQREFLARALAAA